MRFVSACGVALFARAVCAQEAGSGFDLRTTIAAGTFYSHELSKSPRLGSPFDAGFQALLYPTWKLNEHWTISGAMQITSRPYFQEQFTTQGRGVRGQLLQLNLSYARFWNNGSVVVRAGQLSSAFGSFLQRYDPAVNPLMEMPAAYGYYYKPVTFAGLAGAQVDVTSGKWDARAQFVNSSPANPRSIFDREQYGNWAGGAGYTIRQGFRIGASAYYGPYLHRQYRFFRPGEVRPKDLPAQGVGIDVQWGQGPWNVWGEWQRFQMDYTAIPNFTQHTAYAELRRVLSPRWYAATRIGYLRASAFPGSQTYEFAAGLRPNRHQILKFGYRIAQGPAIRGTLGNTAFVQLVSSIQAFSFSRD